MGVCKRCDEVQALLPLFYLVEGDSGDLGTCRSGGRAVLLFTSKVLFVWGSAWLSCMDSAEHGRRVKIIASLPRLLAVLALGDR
jgi:hypothetical protein